MTSALGTNGPAVAPDRVTVRSYPTYAEAQRAVDHLSDTGFPVDRVSIVGTDLRLVETVLGRLTRGRAALAGAGSGAWVGLFVGVLLAVLAPEGTSALAALLDAVAFGVLFGAVLGFTAHAMTRGRRDFASRSSVVAAQYEVRVDPAVGDDATYSLVQLAWRTS